MAKLFHRFSYLVVLFAVSHLAAEPVVSASVIQLPAGITKLARPAAACYDARHGETYVADTGNNRIVIFDRKGNFSFEFSDDEHLGAPMGLAVDSLGRIFVHTERSPYQLQVFDFDGTWLQSFPLHTAEGESLRVSSFVLDSLDRLFVLSAEPARIHIYATSGSLISSFDLFRAEDSFKEEDRSQPILGALSIVNHTLCIPLPMFAQIVRYSFDGRYMNLFGISGGAPGEFSFPVSVAATEEGHLLVLDKHRHTILEFTDQGRFIREFGGMGVSAGWFYHPIAICAMPQGEFLVLQSFQDRVQRVELPGIDDMPEGDAIAVQPLPTAVPASSTDKKP